MQAIVDAAQPPLYNFPMLASVPAAVEHHLRQRHPELSAEALRAVTNRFSYDWK